ncbi:hypothetical protein LTS18_013037 [Coniosporium uncinatum]|uniref:Uncharacterized protein n=1 Tax=Coniosporium uncinatum TaxID=93489 RepID=A0ACC3D9A7_9PEZI|nr:hypothetical protein LTS18_013037 [Coniosporium uncinatum]
MVYPKKSSSDASYDLSESALRRVIHIPSTFTYGQKPAVILVSGTGSKGCLTFGANFIKKLTGVSYADPVWLNMPGGLLGDAQSSAEYVAYAINYISGISGNTNVSVIGWSQGSLDTQWALKYWPSTRSVTSDLIGISPSFHGSKLAHLICPLFPMLPCPPSIIQQGYNSNYITRLRQNGGDSAYVPTTSIWSITDEILQPQAGTSASAYIRDARGVGASNNQLQTICEGQSTSLFYTHEGVLYNPVAFALAVDALKNHGPGNVDRVDTTSLCQATVTEKLNPADVLATEGNMPAALEAIALRSPKVWAEPILRPYAGH